MTKNHKIATDTKISGGLPRKNFGRIEELATLPDLIEIQSRSFNDYAQLDFLPSERKNIGLEKVFRNVFPIESGEKISLEYVSYELGDWSCICGVLTGIEKRYIWACNACKKSGSGRIATSALCKTCNKGELRYKRCVKCYSRVSLKIPMSADNCRHSGKTYALPLKIRLRLLTWDQPMVDAKKKTVKDIREQDVFFCSMPVMVDQYVDSEGNIKLGSNGTFIINGVDRVVVSQIHRAPGVLFVLSKRTKDLRGDSIPCARLIPSRGVWLDFEFDSKDLICVKVDKKKKILATTFLQAIGVPREEILSHFYKFEKIHFKAGKFFRPVDQDLLGFRITQVSLPEKLQGKIPEGARVNKDILALFKKSGVKQVDIRKESLINRFCARQFIDQSTGEILLEPGDCVYEEVVERMAMSDEGVVSIIDNSGYIFQPSIAITLANDSVNTYEKAVVEVYCKLKSGDLPTFDVMVETVSSAFFSHRFYDLTSVGRVRINRKLNLELDLEKTALTKEDILETVKYLIGLKERGEGEIDDIDHLSSRCVRLVDELLQNQLYSGFARVEKIVKERFRLHDATSSMMPYDFVNVKPISAAINGFFGTGQLSQFMDQTNPLSEMAHKRRLSALGPGGITRDRASLEVRDVHTSHYGRICPIETPDGHNIGLISSLATYANVNELGFLETAYRKVEGGVVGDKVFMLDAYQEKGKAIAKSNTPLDANGKIQGDAVLCRQDGDLVQLKADEVDFIDSSPRQLVSIATSLIPFLENDDANRALMGSNMQRQAVPLIAPQSPIVGTGTEIEVGTSGGSVVLAKNPGIVRHVSATKIIVELDQMDISDDEWVSNPVDVYLLKKFGRSSHNTWIHQTPIVAEGQRIKKNDILTDGSSISKGELSLGSNVLVAFMPWDGYNFEDAIAVSKRLMFDDVFSSVHVEEFSVEARDTKLGAEEITKDIPGISEKELEALDEDGVVKIGTRVAPGDIIVGKVTLKGDVQVSPEDKLLRAIFGEKSREVKDTSSRVPPGVNGVIIDVKVFSRSGVRKDQRYKDMVDKETAKLDENLSIQIDIIKESFKHKILQELAADKKLKAEVSSKQIDKLTFDELIKFESKSTGVARLKALFEDKLMVLKALRSDKIAEFRRGDDLPSGVIKMVRVYIGMKRPISVGDKLAGRHGNKGVVSKIFNIEDMPYMVDGTPVDIVLNPLGVPGRMNLGQILETMLGMACRKIGADLAKQIEEMSEKQVKDKLTKLFGAEIVKSIETTYGKEGLLDTARLVAKKGLHIRTPVFDGANYEEDVCGMLAETGLPLSGKYELFDGRTGEKFVQPVTVGCAYMMKLNHMVDDKIHARSVGPYSLITQQPLGGKAKFGGQRLGEMEVWALFAYGAAYTLQEMLTIKSDDVTGRSKAYEAIVHGDEVPEPGLPESFNVLVKELQSLGLQVDLFESDRELVQ
jgi:DNA-directed RNA polymerase subunit beta